MCVIGSTCGESLIPLVAGLLLHYFGADGLPGCILSVVILMCILYGAIHYLLITRYSVSSTNIGAEKPKEDNLDKDAHQELSSTVITISGDVSYIE
jgi:hypothetical protein